MLLHANVFAGFTRAARRAGIRVTAVATSVSIAAMLRPTSYELNGREPGAIPP